MKLKGGGRKGGENEVCPCVILVGMGRGFALLCQLGDLQTCLFFGGGYNEQEVGRVYPGNNGALGGGGGPSFVGILGGGREG